MGDKSKIEWTEATWNPAVGCTKVGAGCDNCYAERMANRMFHNPKSKYNTPDFGVQLFYDRLDQPIRWKRPRIIFVNSMSDLFHKEIPDLFIDRVFDTMEKADHHIYQILTKRSSRMRDYVNRRYPRPWIKPAHLWFGVSVENGHTASRIEHLQQINSANRFVSFEPLLAPLGMIVLKNIHWAIVGGESGHGARPMKKDWAINIRDICKFYGVAFFFKQWGAYGEDGVHRTKYENGRLLGGREYSEYPAGMKPNGGGLT